MSLTGIARKISAYRKANSLTIQQMAQNTGLSTALISQLERELANPSLSVLEILASALGLTISLLVEDEVDEESLVLRAANREQTYNPNDIYLFYNLLTPSSMNSGITMTLVHLEPNSETYNGEFHCHKVEEIVFMLTGSITVLYEYSEINLYCGDTLRIPANKKHRYLNRSGAVSELLTIKADRNY